MTAEQWQVLVPILVVVFGSVAGLYLYVAKVRTALRDRQEAFETAMGDEFSACSRSHEATTSAEFEHVNGELSKLTEAVTALREMAVERFAAIEVKLDVLFQERGKT